MNNSDTGVSGDGSLRGEIAAAVGGDTINFDPSLSGQTITLAQTLNITQNLTITGLGASQIAISADNGVQALSIGSGITVTLSGLSIINVNSTNTYGGGIFNNGTLTVGDSTFSGNSVNGWGGGIVNNGTLTVSNSTFSGNSADTGGGGIFNFGTMTVSHSRFTDNSAGFGGGIANGSNLTVTDSTFSGNTAPGGGGGAIASDGSLIVVGNSTFNGNSAATDGGGIYNSGYLLEVSNSTFAANTTNQDGGAIANFARLLLNNSTLSGNSASSRGGGIFNSGSNPATVTNTIVAQNSASSSGPDVSGDFISHGHNLVGDGTGASGFTGTGDQVGTSASPIDPQLGPLQDNGGPTRTMALLSRSPAIDAGDNTGAPDTDQRGFTRIVNGTIDIGAFEFAAPLRPTALSWDDTRGGVNYSYQIAGAALAQDTTIALYWSSTASFADRIGWPIEGTTRPITAGSSVGTYGPFHVRPGLLWHVPDGAAYLLLVSDPDNRLGGFSDANNVLAVANPLFVQHGQFTFNVEGNDDPVSPYYSRHISWPGAKSGVTIGRGYDMRYRAACDVYHDLATFAGVPTSQAQAIAAGAGLSPDQARTFVRNNQAIIGDITRAQQQALFAIDYPRYVTFADARYSTITRGLKGAVPWSALDPAIAVIVVDFAYQYGPYFTTGIVRAAMGNDYTAVVSFLEQRRDDPVRNEERISYLQEHQ